jgi:AcrR family transcriptional regulator
MSYQAREILCMNDTEAGGHDLAWLGDPGNPLRERVLRSAFELFLERGFAKTSMLEIATRAQVSKRDLYALFENKHALLAYGIGERAKGMRLLGATMPVPSTRQVLAAALAEVGASILRTVCDAEVLMFMRLAIAESDRAPEIARILDSNGRAANHRALAGFLKQAQIQGLIGPGDPAAVAARFSAVLWGDLLVRLLLRVCDAPGAQEIEARALAATEAVLG